MVVEGTLAWYGETNVTMITEDKQYELEANQYGFQLQVLGIYPVLPWLTAHVKAGGTFWRVEMDIIERSEAGIQDFSKTDDSAEFIFGIGARAKLSSTWVASLDWDQTEVNGLDLSSLNLGMGFRF